MNLRIYALKKRILAFPWADCSPYLLLVAFGLIALFLGFGPFVKIVDPQLEGGSTILSGFAFAHRNVLGDFVVMFSVGVVYIAVVILLAAVQLFLPVRWGQPLFWVLAVWGILGLLTYGAVFNYYLFSFLLGSFSQGVHIYIGSCGIIYDLLIVLIWIPFFVLHHLFSGGTTGPAFGTFLDEDHPDKKR